MPLSVLVWVLLFSSLLLGIPIFVSLAIASIVSLYLAGVPLNIITLDLFKVSEMFPLLAVPCFVLAGSLMERGGMAGQIVEVAQMLVGRVKGGLAIVTILGCVFFASMIGSGPGTVAAMGALMIPSMVKRGYGKDYAAGVSCTGGTLGILIPPSNPMIIYGVVGQVSVASLFMGGFIPGAMVGVFLIITAYMIARKRGYQGDTRKYTPSEFLRTALKNIWSLAAPIIILGGIYAGVFTPVEASVIAVAYALFVGLFITKGLNVNKMIESLKTTNVSTAIIMIIVAVSTLFGRFLTMNQVPQTMADWVLSISTNPEVVLLMICGFLFILGMFMETLATIVILTPILLPIATQLGIDPVHLGVLIVMTNEVAMLSPPLGVNLFVAMSLTNLSLEKVAKSTLPFMAAVIVAIIIVIFFPEIVLFLPRVLGGYGG